MFDGLKGAIVVFRIVVLACLKKKKMKMILSKIAFEPEMDSSFKL